MEQMDKYEVLLDIAKHRRTCRNFSAAPVADDLVEKILEVARWAPSGANSQPWSFIVVRDSSSTHIVKSTWISCGGWSR